LFGDQVNQQRRVGRHDHLGLAEVRSGLEELGEEAKAPWVDPIFRFFKSDQSRRIRRSGQAQ